MKDATAPDEFEKITLVEPPFDKRHTDPKKNYGVHGMTLRFILKGPKGATQFVYYTAQQLPHVADEWWLGPTSKYNPFHGMGADIGYHAPSPQYEGQEAHDCDVLPQGKCYYDGSGLAAAEFEAEFLAGGSEVVWPMLLRRYNELFEVAV